MQHRPRCNTDLKLDKMRREKRALMQSKASRTVHWKEMSAAKVASGAAGGEEQPGYTRQETMEMFPEGKKKGLHKGEERKKDKVSLLTELLDSVSTEATPFMDYSHFAAATLETARRLRVFFNMSCGGDRPFPLAVSVAEHATVKETIGYICLQYTKAGRRPELREDVDR
jgi:hypothetical protein